MPYDNLTFVNVPVIQSNVDARFGIVLKDIESRMPKGHQYSDRDLITWAHETTHGLNAKVRNEHYQPNRVINAFYVLEGKALVIDEPTHIRISQAAPQVPSSLRGQIYDLYMVKQPRNGWDNRPLYMWDEFTAYTNGSMTRTDLKISTRAETVKFMWEMAVYGSYVAMIAERDIINEGLKYLLDRASIGYYSSTGTNDADEYLSKIKDTKKLMDYWASIGFRFLENV